MQKKANRWWVLHQRKAIGHLTENLKVHFQQLMRHHHNIMWVKTCAIKGKLTRYLISWTCIYFMKFYFRMKLLLVLILLLSIWMCHGGGQNPMRILLSEVYTQGQAFVELSTTSLESEVSLDKYSIAIITQDHSIHHQKIFASFSRLHLNTCPFQPDFCSSLGF